MGWTRVVDRWRRPRGGPGWPLGSAAVIGTLLVQWPAQLPTRSTSTLLLAAAVVPLLVALAIRRWRHRSCWLAVVMLAFGSAGLRAHDALSRRPAVALDGRELIATGAVRSMIQEADHGVRFRFRVDHCVWADAAIDRPCPAPLDVSAAWHLRFDHTPAALGAAPAPGERWRLVLRLRSVLAKINPAGADAELIALEQGIDALATVRADRANRRLDGDGPWLETIVERLRNRLREGIRRATEDTRPEIAGVLSALTIGEQGAIPPAWWQRFNATGVGHLMSISGLHITMIAALGGTLAGAAWRWIARGTGRHAAMAALLLRCPRQHLRWAVAIVCAFGYSAIAGWGIPAQRTCWMVAVAGWVVLGGRTRSMTSALWLAAAIVVASDPWAVWSPGFWLSFGAVAAIVRLGAASAMPVHGPAAAPPRAKRGDVDTPAGSPNAFARWARWRDRLRRPLVEAAATQWAASVALLPLGVWFFSSISIVGPLANLVAIPLVSAIVTPMALAGAGASLVCDVCAAFVMQAPIGATDLLLQWLQWLDRWPAAAVTVPRPSIPTLLLGVAGAFVLLAPWPWPGRAIAASALLPLLLTPVDTPPPGTLRITAFDVGQGMAVLVETSRRRLLYDTGPRYGSQSDAGLQVILPYLRSRGISHLDLLVVSHADNDHAAGAASIVERIGVGRIASSLVDGHPLTRAGPPAEPCVRGLGWQWDDAVFTWLHPGLEHDGVTRAAANARSCVLRIETPGGSVLLAGDVQHADERRMLSALEPERLQADLLLVPNHGSNASSSAAFLDAVAPRIAIIQAGYRNRYRHPHPKVLERLAARGIDVLRTDRHGAVRVELEAGRSPRVHRMRIDESAHWRVRIEGDQDPLPLIDSDRGETAADRHGDAGAVAAPADGHTSAERPRSTDE